MEQTLSQDYIVLKDHLSHLQNKGPSLRTLSRILFYEC